MRQQFEYFSLHLAGLGEDDVETPDPAAIDMLLKERARAYNRLGFEGWMLIAEHQDDATFSVVATFRREVETREPAQAPVREASLSAAPAAAGRTTYPVLQPDPSAPDAYRLVWER